MRSSGGFSKLIARWNAISGSLPRSQKQPVELLVELNGIDAHCLAGSTITCRPRMTYVDCALQVYHTVSQHTDCVASLKVLQHTSSGGHKVKVDMLALSTSFDAEGWQRWHAPLQGVP